MAKQISATREPSNYHISKYDVTREPSPCHTVLFYNIPMKMDKLGNVTYGFLGYAYGIDLNTLIVGSHVAAGMPKSGDAYFQEMEDWEYIEYGYMSAQRYYS